MDDGCKRSNIQFGLIDSSSYIICGGKDCSKRQADLFKSQPLSEDIQAEEAEPVEVMSTKVHVMSSVLRKPVASVEQATDPKSANPIKISHEPYCHVKLDSLNKLKDSTRKLLRLLDNIQAKTYSKVLPPLNRNEGNLDFSTVECIKKSSFISDGAEPALRNLEAQTQELNNIYIEDEDDCSIFKRLTRKCNCLNQEEYNDFMIHFNENTKYFTSTSGEIIKNLRILKKFLYMGGTYTKNALLFLNEGLEKSEYTEKVEITHGCSHSDLCNVFEDHSLVILCISWPCKFPYYGDSVTQNLAASFLYKLAQVEEGRRYLKYTTKITNDIKRVIRKNESKLEFETTEILEATLNLIHPPMTQNTIIYSPQNDEGKLKTISTEINSRQLESPCCSQRDFSSNVHLKIDGITETKGFVTENITALQNFRQYMTLGEVFMHLDSLANLSYKGKGKTDLTFHLPILLLLFKRMLEEYDNSEMNIVITKILNNIVVKNMLKQKELDEPIIMTVADTATEPVAMKNEIIQMPQKQIITKKPNKSKLNLGTKFRQPLKHQVSESTKPPNPNRSRKFAKNYGSDVIVVPFDKKNKSVAC